MTTEELLAALGQAYPYGVSFDPMAMRLFRKKIPCDDLQLKELTTLMFKLGNGLWYNRLMIIDEESRIALEERALEWLMDARCFSIQRLYNEFQGVCRNIDTVKDFARFLRYMGFTVAKGGTDCYFCFQPQFDLVDILTAIAKTIADWLDKADGRLTISEIEQAMPNLTIEALAGIRMRFLPEVNHSEACGVPCWCTTESITLPEDFSEKLTAIVDTLIGLGEKVTVAKLEFALNLFYRAKVRKEYFVPDDDTFLRICAMHYRGESGCFRKLKAIGLSGSGSSNTVKRLRSPNTRFSDLAVPIGAELYFTKDDQISCFVKNESNQVVYDHKIWSISSFANYLLGTSSVNGFRCFRYEGETLWERRLRLET